MTAWISVKDRLPEIDIAKDFFGLASDGRSVVTAWYWRRHYNAITGEKQDSWGLDRTGRQLLDGYITHWMPLPDPPNSVPQMRTERETAQSR